MFIFNKRFLLKSYKIERDMIVAKMPCSSLFLILLPDWCLNFTSNEFLRWEHLNSIVRI
jgi:hypothetical protein